MAGDTLALQLIASFVAAFRPHVEHQIEEKGFDRPPDLDAAVREGEAWLKATLESTLARPFAHQSRGPLEVFQEATRFAGERLADLGQTVPTRDETVRAALPGDTYGLAPASPRLLGEEAWRAHLAWGAAKAQKVAPGVVGSMTVALVSVSLTDRNRVEAEVARHGSKLVVWAGPESAGSALAQMRPSLALVDLEATGSGECLRLLVEAGVPAFAFGRHVDSEAKRRAEELGADEALPRSQFFDRLPELLASAGFQGTGITPGRGDGA